MTTSTTTPRVAYTADGSTVSFTFNFEIADSSSIAVYEGSTKKTLTTHYTISFDSGTSGTGSVVFVSAPSDSTVITFVRDTNLARTTDFTQSGAFLADTVNAELDRLSQAVIDATDKIENRAISTAEPNTDTATMTIPAAATRANKVLGFDSSGNAEATTASSGDVTLTGSQTLTNKAIDADNNTISNLEVDNIKAATLVTESEGIGSNDNDTTLPTSAAVKDYVDTQITAEDLDITTDSGTIAIDLDGETLTVAGGTGLSSSASSNTVTLAIDSTVATLTGSQSLTNKTLTSPVLDTGVSGTAIKDEDTMSSDSATHLATQQSIKAYVDATVTAQDLDFQGDSGGALNIDLDSETLDIAGGTGIDTAGSGNTLTVAIDSTVATLTGSQSLTNKTLTSPVLNTGVSGTAIKDEDNFSSNSATHLATQQSIKAYVDAQDAATGIGDLTATGSTLISPSNADLTLDPSGSGSIVLNANTSVTGSVTATTSIENDAIRITDNTIVGLRSNDDLIIDPAGTGEIRPGSDVKLLSNSHNFVGNVTNEDGNALQLSSSAGITLSNNVTGYGYIETTGDDSYIQTESIKIDAGSGVISGRRSNEDLIIDPAGTGSVAIDKVAITGGVITGITDLTVADGGTGASSLTDNAVLTGTGTSPITAESNLTFNGSTLAVTGNITATTSIANDAVSIDDNVITASRSNDNLVITANGTGKVMLGNQDTDITSVGSNKVGATMLFEDLTASGGTRQYALNRIAQFKAVANTDSNSTNDRFRIQDTVQFDLNGSTYSQTSNSRGPQIQHLVEIKNTGSSTSDTLGAANGQATGIFFPGSGGAGSTINLTNAYNIRAFSLLTPESGETVNVTNNYDFYSSGPTFAGSGTEAVTNHYGLFVSNNTNATNKYGVYVEGDSYINQLGGVTLQNGDITASGVTITDNHISTAASNADLHIDTSGTGKVITNAVQVGVGDQTGGNIILTDQADGSFQTAQFANPGMLNPSGLQVDSAGSFHYSQLILNNFSTNAYNALWTTRSNSNTHGANAYLDSGDVIFQFFGAGWNGDTDGSGYFSGNTLVDLYASEAHSASNRGGGFRIKTINKGAASGATEKLRVEDHVETHEKLEFKKNYQENIDALTSSSTITVDCSAASVFTVTLATNTGFVISNLPTGGSVTLIITQDGTGSRTATFGTDGSTAVKFAGGSKTLSTAASAIDVVSIFNDGTNYIGNLSLSYAA